MRLRVKWGLDDKIAFWNGHTVERVSGRKQTTSDLISGQQVTTLEDGK